MTVGEAMRACTAYNEQRKERAYFAWTQAYATGLFIASMFSKSSPPGISDIYPDLFPKDEKSEDKEQELKDAKSEANFLAFAQAFNRKFDYGSDRKSESENNGRREPSEDRDIQTQEQPQADDQ